jgi:hypothetical protein
MVRSALRWVSCVEFIPENPASMGTIGMALRSLYMKLRLLVAALCACLVLTADTVIHSFMLWGTSQDSGRERLPVLGLDKRNSAGGRGAARFAHLP